MDRLLLFETFVKVVEAGNLSRAARQLGSSLSAVSRQIGALEEHLGAGLFDRTNRAVRLTPSGQRFYPHALAVLRATEEAKESVAPQGALDATVRVSAPVALGITRIVASLSPLLARHERLKVELLIEDRTVDLVEDGIDIVVRMGTRRIPDSSDLIAQRLASFRFVPCASPAFVTRHGAPAHPSELAKLPLVNYVSLRGAKGWPFHRDTESVEVPVEAHLWTNDALAMLEAARAGVGVALLPDWLAEADLVRGTLHLLLPGWSLPEGEAWIAYRTRGRGKSAVRAVVDHLTASLRFEAPASEAKKRLR